MASLLIAHLCDTSLRGISRHLNDDLTYEEIVELLKKSQGYAKSNTKKHITDMAARKRLKSEKVMDNFVDLSRKSELASRTKRNQRCKSPPGIYQTHKPSDDSCQTA